MGKRDFMLFTGATGAAAFNNALQLYSLGNIMQYITPNIRGRLSEAPEGFELLLQSILNELGEYEVQ